MRTYGEGGIQRCPGQEPPGEKAAGRKGKQSLCVGEQATVLGSQGVGEQEDLRMWVPTSFFKIDQLEEDDTGPGLEMTRTCIKLGENRFPRG